MNKKVISLIALVLLISFCFVNVAVAGSSFSTKLMDLMQKALELDDSDFVTIMMSEDVRVGTMAILYAEYIASNDELDGAREVNDFNFFNDSYICQFGSTSIDAYFRLANGKYLNLFYMADTNTIDICGITSTYQSANKTMYEIDGVELMLKIVDLAKMLNDLK